MATSNSRDVTLTLSVDTLGEDNVKKLQASVQALAKEGGDAAPEFQKLADEIAQLGAQNTALQSFKALGDETQVLRDKQEALVQSSAQMAAKLDELRAATDAAKAGQSAASEALTAGRLAYVEAGNAIRILKTEYDASGKGTKEYREKLNALTGAHVEAKAALVTLGAEQKATTAGASEAGNAIRILKTEYDAAGKGTKEYRQKLNALTVAHAKAKAALVTLGAEQKATTAGASEAVSAQGKLETAYNRSVSAVGKVEAALKTQETALQQAAAAANELGVSTSEIATSEAQLLSAFNAAGTAARTRAEATKEMAESDRLLAIEEQGMIALLARGEQALQAEVLAQRDAARAAEEYAAAKAQATANEAKWQQEAEAIVNAAHAAQELARQTQVLSAAGKELSAQRAFEQQAEDAKKLVNAAEYVRLWETALQQADAQATATAAAASAAADKIQNAFKTVGVRSAQELQAEIAQVREAMATISGAAGAAGSSLKGAFSAGEAKIAALELELRKLNGSLTLGDKAAGLFANSMGQITAGNVIADGVGYLVNKVKEAGVAFFSVNIEAQRLSKALGLIYGDSKVAGDQLTFLNKTADDAGVSVRGITDSFIGFTAATKASNIPIATVNDVFQATTRAAGQLGLGTEQVNGILLALGQVASKGTLQMEELRGQIGDRLPGALSIAAKGLGVTEEKLVQLVSTGSVTANVFFPAFAKGLNETFAGGTTAVDGFLQGFNRLQNAIVNVAKSAADSSVFSALGKTFDFLAVNINGVVTSLKLLGEGFLALKAVDAVSAFLGLGKAAATATAAVTAKTAAVVADTAAVEVNTLAQKSSIAATVAATAAVESATVASRAATVAKGALAVSFGALGTAARGAAALVGGLPGVLVLVALNAKDMGTWIGESIAKMTHWGTEMKASEKKLADLSEQERKSIDQKRLATAAQDLQNVKMTEASVLATKLAVTAAENADKEFKASQERAKTLEAVGKLAGDEATALGNAAIAATGLSFASDNLVKAKQALVDKTAAEILAIQQTTGANGQLTETQKTQITTLQGLLEGRKQDVIQTKAQSDGLYIEAAARRIASQTYQDNAGRVKELAQEYANAKAKVEILKASGVATFDQIQKAEIDATTAARIYYDALGDVTRQLARTAQEHANKNVISNAGLNLELAQARAYESSNKALGNQLGVVQAQIQQKQIEIKQIEANVAAMRQEADDTIKVSEAKLTELKASGQLTPELKLELETRIANSKAKKIDADATAESVESKRDEITEIQNTARALNSETAAREKAATAREKEIALAEKENELKQRAIDLENKRLGQDKNGFATDKAGNTLVAGGDLTTRTGIKAFLTSAGVKDDAAATQITNEFANSTGGIDHFNNAGQRKYGGSTISDALLKAAEKYTFSAAAVAASQAAAKPAATATTGTSSTKTVNVVINGVSTAVNVASASDQTALVSVIRQLEAAAKGTA